MRQATDHGGTGPRLRIPVSVGLGLFLTVALLLLWQEHKLHILGAAPYALLLLCPAVHLFMHRGHGGEAPQPAHHEHGEPRS